MGFRRSLCNSCRRSVARIFCDGVSRPLKRPALGNLLRPQSVLRVTFIWGVRGRVWVEPSVCVVFLDLLIYVGKVRGAAEAIGLDAGRGRLSRLSAAPLGFVVSDAPRARLGVFRSVSDYGG